ncbi:hypothetical protein [Streptomyces capparidis]
MALPKKGSRRIVVDSVAYRWRVRGRPTYDQAMCWWPLTYAVELADAPGRTLVVVCDRPHPGNWWRAPTRPVLPAEVAATVRSARGAGWDPGQPGPPYFLDRSAGFVRAP